MKRIMKKILSLILSIIIVFSLCVTHFADGLNVEGANLTKNSEEKVTSTEQIFTGEDSNEEPEGKSSKKLGEVPEKDSSEELGEEPEEGSNEEPERDSQEELGEEPENDSSEESGEEPEGDSKEELGEEPEGDSKEELGEEPEKNSSEELGEEPEKDSSEELGEEPEKNSSEELEEDTEKSKTIKLGSPSEADDEEATGNEEFSIEEEDISSPSQAEDIENDKKVVEATESEITKLSTSLFGYVDADITLPNTTFQGDTTVETVEFFSGAAPAGSTQIGSTLLYKLDKNSDGKNIAIYETAGANKIIASHFMGFFSGCTNLRTVTNFDVLSPAPGVTGMGGCFSDCTKLEGTIKVNQDVANQIDIYSGMFQSAGVDPSSEGISLDFSGLTFKANANFQDGGGGRSTPSKFKEVNFSGCTVTSMSSSNRFPGHFASYNIDNNTIFDFSHITISTCADTALPGLLPNIKAEKIDMSYLVCPISNMQAPFIAQVLKCKTFDMSYCSFPNVTTWSSSPIQIGFDSSQPNGVMDDFIMKGLNFSGLTSIPSGGTPMFSMSGRIKNFDFSDADFGNGFGYIGTAPCLGYGFNVENLNMDGLNAPAVTTLAMLFTGNNLLKKVSLKNATLGTLTDLHNMFEGCSALEEFDLSLNTSSVTNMSYMFDDCTSLKNIDLSIFNTSSVTDMKYMFAGCNSLTYFKPALNTTSVSDMTNMFADCSSLKELDLTSFNTAALTTSGAMFSNDLNLESIYVNNNFVVDGVTFSYNMFYSCTKLIGEAGTEYQSGSEDKTYAHIDGGQTNAGYFSGPPAITLRPKYFKYNVSVETVEFKSAAAPSEAKMIGLQENLFLHDVDHDGKNLVIYETQGAGKILTNLEGLFDSCANLKTVTNFEMLEPTTGSSSAANCFNGCTKLGGSIKLNSAFGGKIKKYENMFVNAGTDSSSEGVSVDFSGITFVSQADFQNGGGGQSNPSKFKEIDFSGCTITDMQTNNQFPGSFASYNIDNDTIFDFSNITILNCNGMADMLPNISAKKIDISNLVCPLTAINSPLGFQVSKCKTFDMSNLHFPNVTTLGYSSINIGFNSSHNTEVMDDFIMKGLDFSALTFTGGIGSGGPPLIQFQNGTVKNFDISGADFGSGFGFVGRSPFFGSNIPADNINLDNFKAPAVTTLGMFFTGNSKLKKVSLKNVTFGPLTNLSGMFQGCSALEEIDYLSALNTSSVTDMSLMFLGCFNLKDIDLSALDTSSVSNMQQMFSACDSLTCFKPELNTTSVSNMQQMFDGCDNLTELDLTSFNTAALTNASKMFIDDTKLEAIYVSNNFVVNGVTNDTNMFSNCTSLVGEAGTVYDSSHTDKIYAHIDGGTSNPGYFSGPAPITLPSSYFKGNTNVETIEFKSAAAPSAAKMIDSHEKLFIHDVNGDGKKLVIYETAGENKILANLKDLFNGCTSLKTIINFDILKPTMACNSAENCFYGCTKLQGSFKINSDFANQILDYTQMFGGAGSDSSSTGVSVDFSHNTFPVDVKFFEGGAGARWNKVDFSYCTFSGMTQNSSAYFPSTFVRNNIDTGNTNIDLSHITVLSGSSFLPGSFQTANAKKIDISYLKFNGTSYSGNIGFQPAKCETLDASHMDFSGLTTLASCLPISLSVGSGEMTFIMKGLDFSGLNSIPAGGPPLFSGQSGGIIKNFDLSEADFGNGFAANSSSPFAYLYVENINLEGAKIPSVTSLQNWFKTVGSGTNTLKSVSLKNATFGTLTNCQDVFSNNTQLETVNLIGLDTSSVTNMSNMFDNCPNLKTIYVDEKFVVDNVTTDTDMFNSCINLVGGAGTKYDSSHIDKTYAHIDGGKSNPGYLSKEVIPVPPKPKPVIPIYGGGGSSGGGGAGLPVYGSDGTVIKPGSLQNPLVATDLNTIWQIHSWNGNSSDVATNIIYDTNTKEFKDKNTNGFVYNKWIGASNMNNTVWFHTGSDGKVQKGLININNDIYYFNEDGIMLTGYQTINGVKYYFSEEKNANEGKLITR